MNNREKNKKETPDFIAIKKTYESLDNGPKADIRRVGKPEDLRLAPGFYRLRIKCSGKIENIYDSQWKRIAFILPHAGHSDGGPSLGQALHLHERVAEARVFQVTRSRYPNDLIQLRRLCVYVKPTVDWQKLGETLYYWGDEQKRKLMEDFYLGEKKQQALKNQEENNSHG
ncbi:MAG: type I-E CRISPR-associated protein Cse2/CasB [Nitrospinales bacterium]